jgi:hypothetical protein
VFRPTSSIGQRSDHSGEVGSRELPSYAGRAAVSTRQHSKNRRVTLPEDEPLPVIEAFFAGQHFRVVVHEESPPDPMPDEWRAMPSSVRRAHRDFRPAYWADLERLETGKRVPWYGGGEDPELAVRHAGSRWRVEQGD